MAAKTPLKALFDNDGNPTSLAEYTADDWLRSDDGGTGYITYSNGEILIGNSAGSLSRSSLTGTSNQINIINGSGSIQLALPQNIHTGATPTFAGLTINGAGTVISNDIIKRSNPINVSRWAMAIVMIIATLIAIYRIDIWILVSTFGLLRIIMIAPTLYALLSKKKIPTELLFYVLTSITILGIGSTFTTLPIDRAALGLILFLIPVGFIGYEHFKK